MMAPRPRRHLRHLDRASGGRARPAGLGRAEKGRGMALVARSRRFAVVSDDASLSPEAARRLERRLRRDGGAPRLARRRTAAPERPIAIPGAVGELIDKITILEIKSRRIVDDRQGRATCAGNSGCSNDSLRRRGARPSRSRRAEGRPRRGQRAALGRRGRNPPVRKERRVRRTIRRARPLRLCDQRSPRRDQARHQPLVQFGDRRGKVLRLSDGGRRALNRG